MPYIGQVRRRELAGGRPPETPGELNYLLTRMADEYLQRKGVSYATVNAVVGVFECAKLELYRRIAVPYESRKWGDNGDVFAVENTRRGDPEPQPSDGPDYHADHAAWERRQ